jgi:RNA polymerase sigma-70 factor (ECF subfamily)
MSPFTYIDRRLGVNIPIRLLIISAGIKKRASQSLLRRLENVTSEGLRLPDKIKAARFEETVLPHLPAAYNLARWLVHNEHDAEDLVQEAYLRAFKFFSGYYGGDSRAWLLTIVRNTCYTWLQQNRALRLIDPIDDKLEEVGSDFADPETLLLQDADSQLVRQALEELPVEFREIVVMREMEGLAYKEIANIVDIPIGTVMSRLARGRKRLQALLVEHLGKEVQIEL